MDGMGARIDGMSGSDRFEAFARALKGCETSEEAFRLYQAEMRRQGYCSVDFCSGIQTRWPMANASEWLMDVMLASFPAQHQYAGTDSPEFLRYDRTIPLAARRTIPWLSWDLWEQPAEDPMERDIEDRLQSLFTSALVVPIHSPGLRFTGVFLGSDLPREELEKLDRETRPDVFLATALFNARFAELLGQQDEGERALTDRERECLLWAARGKTAWETSMILSISESAVKKHLGRSAAKLNALTRTHAVANAISRGLIGI